MATLSIGTPCFKNPVTQMPIHVRFSNEHNFVKPNDLRALQLMDHAARDVMEEYSDIVLGFGESDEFRLAYFFDSY